MTFNIGNQTGGVINNVAGDQHISGGQQGVLVTTEDVRRTLASLRQAVTAASIDQATQAGAQAEIAVMDEAIRAERPDRHRFAGALERLTRLLAAAGSLTTAGAVLTGPLHAMATWLAPSASPCCTCLPGSSSFPASPGSRARLTSPAWLASRPRLPDHRVRPPLTSPAA